VGRELKMKQLKIKGTNGLQEKIQISIERLKLFEQVALQTSDEGFYLAYSGGKDSDVILKLAEMAGIKFKAYHNLTTVDPPELVEKIKQDGRITIVKPQLTMWQLIVKKKYPPTRLARYCCQVLKEGGGNGRFVVTGVRWAESARRKNNRNVIETNAYKSYCNKVNDNHEGLQLLENCRIRSKHILNPIIDWNDEDVWDFIRHHKVNYCKLYDEGFKRLGCIGCPLGGQKNQLKQFTRYPKYKEQYIRTFEKMVEARKESGLKTEWNTGEEVFHWWVYASEKTKEKKFLKAIYENQINMFDELED
jgi:phosphoadenosine phosphosulfate reductase